MHNTSANSIMSTQTHHLSAILKIRCHAHLGATGFAMDAADACALAALMLSAFVDSAGEKWQKGSCIKRMIHAISFGRMPSKCILICSAHPKA